MKNADKDYLSSISSIRTATLSANDGLISTASILAATTFILGAIRPVLIVTLVPIRNAYVSIWASTLVGLCLIGFLGQLLDDCYKSGWLHFWNARLDL